MTIENIDKETKNIDNKFHKTVNLISDITKCIQYFGESVINELSDEPQHSVISQKIKNIQHNIAAKNDCNNKKDIDEGIIEGYASVFNIIDSHGDIICKGAFQNAIYNFKNNKVTPKILWQHDTSSPIGIIEDMHEDEHGLFIKCRLLLDIPKGKEAYYLLKNKAIEGFSIGYKIKEREIIGGVQHIINLDLLEISVVTFPACGAAIVAEVKSGINDIVSSVKLLSNKIKNIMENLI